MTAMCYYNYRERERDKNKKERYRKMTMKERKMRIEELENKLFMLNMVDRWTDRIRTLVAETEKELRELKAA